MLRTEFFIKISSQQKSESSTGTGHVTNRDPLGCGGFPTDPDPLEEPGPISTGFWSDRPFGDRHLVGSIHRDCQVSIVRGALVGLARNAAASAKTAWTRCHRTARVPAGVPGR